MSRIGKTMIAVPEGVQITEAEGLVTVKGPKGELSYQLPACTHVKTEDGQAQVTVDNPDDYRQNVLWGTNASILQNMVEGVSNGFSKQLEVNGVGFKVELSGNKLTLNVGYSHPVTYEIPEGISASVEKNVITVSGVDKQLVGRVASQIRSVRKPEPYKGKGIKYVDETIRRKAGKTSGE